MGAFFGIHYKEVPKMKYSLRMIIGDKTVTWAAIDFFAAPVITFPIIVLLSAILKRIKPIWKIAAGGRE